MCVCVCVCVCMCMCMWLATGSSWRFQSCKLIQSYSAHVWHIEFLKSSHFYLEFTRVSVVTTVFFKVPAKFTFPGLD